ncbi:MAG: hypothetical protein MUE44_21355 [Oscillatoriaceae cyanobacterium Prado104]|nr:hypothetical protein [Oscillatoriaceae cyanobacterium Prado104]
MKHQEFTVTASKSSGEFELLDPCLDYFINGYRPHGDLPSPEEMEEDFLLWITGAIERFCAGASWEDAYITWLVEKDVKAKERKVRKQNTKFWLNSENNLYGHKMLKKMYPKEEK